MRHIILVFLMSCLFLVGCSRSQRPNFVIVAVDQLSYADANCARDNDETNSGIGVLCNESVRWTHAYTTNVLSGPALSSLLTGLHPLDTGYRHNGHFLSPEFLNIGEVARSKKYKTLFLSGGAPVLKKTGLGKGFETFDDTLTLLENPWLKPFRVNSQFFINWIDDFQDRPFFAVFYVPDLRYIHRTTTNLAGDPRNKSFDSQLEEFDTILFELIQKIKREGLWDRTHFILLGLQGRNLYDRQEISPHTNLHSEATQVALLWKPTQVKRDAPVSWTIDRNVSISDVGRTLFDLFGTKQPPGKLETISLATSLQTTESPLIKKRIHLMESAWAHWRMGTAIQNTLLLGEELYFHEDRPSLYRTLSDRLEINPFFIEDAQSETIERMQTAANELNLQKYSKPSIPSTSLWNLGYWDWLSPGLSKIREYYASTPWREVPIEARPWLARALIEASDWRSLRQAAEVWRNKQLLWLAHKHLNLPLITTDGCMSLVQANGFTGEESKRCADPVFLEVIGSLKDESRARRWEKILEEKLIMVSVLRMNRALGMVWDVPENFENILSATEILFSSPEYRNQLKTVQRRLKSIDLETTQPERL